MNAPKKFSIGCFLCGILFLFVLIPTFGTVFEVFGILLFGWLNFIGRVFPEIQFNKSAILSGFVYLGLFSFSFHFFCKWLYRQMTASNTSTPSSTSWPARWTVLIVILTILLFGTTLSFVGIVHQTGWLLTSERPLFRNGRRPAAVILNDARQLDAALDQYAIDGGKVGTHPVSFSDLTPYLKPGTRLANSQGIDIEGNPFVIGPTINDGIRVNSKTKEEKSVGDAFWGPYS